jgi:hypothetical protein
MTVFSIESSQLLIRGLPWKSTKAHVSLFLLSHGLDAREDSIDMLCTRRLPNGRAIVYCDSNRTAMKAALAIHLSKFSGRYIEVYVHTDVDKILSRVAYPFDKV